MQGPPNVIFVVVDTLRADRVSCYGYEKETTPNFDTFARNASIYETAISQAAWSIPAHASLLTGLYPEEHGATTIAPILQAQPYLPAILSNAGYETYGVSPNEYVRPLTGFGKGFDEFYPCKSIPYPPIVADTLAPAINWGTKSPNIRYPIERLLNYSRTRAPLVNGKEGKHEDTVLPHVTDILTRTGSPFFLFVNLMDAHLPRSPDPAHFDRFVDDELATIGVVENERAHTYGEGMGDQAIRKMRQLYDADVRTVDDKLGELLDIFDQAGVLDDSLVILVSDHGEQLGEFGMIGHQASLFDPVVSVPLAIRYPDVRSERITEQVEIRRLFQTVLDETGVGSYPERSLASGIGDDVARGTFFTPMMDIGKFLTEREIAYDRKLMGKRFRFERTRTTKQLRFNGKRWQIDLPEAHHCLETVDS